MALQKIQFPNNMRYALIFLALLITTPFLIPWRLAPYFNFYHDVAIVVFTLLFSIVITREKRLYFPVSRVVIYLVVLSSYWFLQTKIINLPYPSQNQRTGLFFLVIAMLAWCLQVLIYQCGRKRIFVWVMWSILISASLQGGVALLQSAGWTKYVSWIIFSASEPSGQYGQRNMLGHQLMWGVFAAVYLFSNRMITPWKSYISLLFFGLVLGVVSSRTVVLYFIVILLLLLIAFLLSKGKIIKARLFVIVGVTLLWLVIAQLLTPLLFEFFGKAQQSGIFRLADNLNGGERLSEWRKAWLTFKEFPLWGAGWNTYAYHSLTKHELISTINDYRESNYSTHCHNVILQILAEMGIVGFIIVFGGFLWIIFPILKNWRDDENATILFLIAISFTHSLLEYPLWHSFFFASFMVFLSLGQPNITKKEIVSDALQRLFLSIALLALFCSFSLLLLHQWRITQVLQETHGKLSMRRAQIEAGYQLGKIFPLLNQYFDLGSLRRIKSTKPALNRQDFAQIERLALSVPNRHVAEHYGFNLYHRGKIQQSLDWMHKVWVYYPRLIPHSMNMIYNESPAFKQLEQPVYEMCLTYQTTKLYPNVSKETCKKPPTQGNY